MKTAEQILWLTPTIEQDGNKWHGHYGTIHAINEARKEVIKECADLLNPECSERMKAKMLSLIKKLK